MLQHAVCPEYVQDVMAARKICDLSEKELWNIKQVQQKLPGEFNVAASTLYGGRYKGINVGCPWASADDDPKLEELVALGRGFSESEAERIFKTAIAFAGNDALFVEVMKSDVRIIRTEAKCFEIVSIMRPDVKTVAEYASVKNHEGDAGCIKALGIVNFRTWEGPGFDEEDLSDDEATSSGAGKPVDESIQSFWLEDEILQLCFVGMKFELIVHRLNIGISFFDTVIGIYPSFHTILQNEKMVDWKEPGRIVLRRDKSVLH